LRPFLERGRLFLSYSNSDPKWNSSSSRAKHFPFFFFFYGFEIEYFPPPFSDPGRAHLYFDRISGSMGFSPLPVSSHPASPPPGRCVVPSAPCVITFPSRMQYPPPLLVNRVSFSLVTGRQFGSLRTFPNSSPSSFL